MNLSNTMMTGEKDVEAFVRSYDSPLCKAISYTKDEERIKAFTVMYAVMRVVDDIVDDKMIDGKNVGKEEILREIAGWRNLVEKSYAGLPTPHPLSVPFRDTITKFKIPERIWDNFFTSMLKDVQNPNLKHFEEFKDYALGAACAPTKIYLFLTLSKNVSGIYTLDDFDYDSAGYNLGIWAYMIHILRDAREDIENNSLYFPDEELAKYHLNKRSLQKIVEKGRSNSDFSSFVSHYISIADSFYQKSIETVESYANTVESPRKFALLLVLRIYKLIEEKIIENRDRLLEDESRSMKLDYPVIVSTLKNELGM